jgi:hypothetical protein
MFPVGWLAWGGCSYMPTRMLQCTISVAQQRYRQHLAPVCSAHTVAQGTVLVGKSGLLAQHTT